MSLGLRCHHLPEGVTERWEAEGSHPAGDKDRPQPDGCVCAWAQGRTDGAEGGLWGGAVCGPRPHVTSPPRAACPCGASPHRAPGEWGQGCAHGPVLCHRTGITSRSRPDGLAELPVPAGNCHGGVRGHRGAGQRAEGHAAWRGARGAVKAAACSLGSVLILRRRAPSPRQTAGDPSAHRDAPGGVHPQKH